MKVSDLFSLTAQSCKSIVKVLLLSRPSSVKNLHPDGPVIIMANGPSLNGTIAESADILKANDTVSVNFAPTAPVFRELKPRFHVMADPLFFCADKPENVRNLYRSLAEVDWPLTLFVPYGDASKIPAEVEKIAVTVTIFDADIKHQNFGQVSNSYVRVVKIDNADDVNGEEVLRFDLVEEFSIETALVVCEIYRYNGDWKFNAVAAGYQGGLEALCRAYGVNV